MVRRKDLKRQKKITVTFTKATDLFHGILNYILDGLSTVLAEVHRLYEYTVNFSV
jgi:hypothetical protein